LVRSAVEGDQRAVQLSLTDAGTELLDAAQKEMISALEGLAARTGRPDEVIEALVTLGSAIDLAAAERRK
jgi:DNA-binding MarR family transcriptional regulator